MALAKFKFRLQRVLEVKEKVEDEKKNIYAEHRKQLEEENRRLERLVEDMEEAKSSKDSINSGSLRISQLSSYSDYMQGLHLMIDKQSVKVVDTEKEVESVRMQLLEATKERRILENLKLKSFEEYKYELKQEEDKMTDQFVSYSSSNNTRED